MIFRFLNVQGIAGLACGLALLGLLLIQKGETRHWKREAAKHEQLYRGEQVLRAHTLKGHRYPLPGVMAQDRQGARAIPAPTILKHRGCQGCLDEIVLQRRRPHHGEDIVQRKAMLST